MSIQELVLSTLIATGVFILILAICWPLYLDWLRGGHEDR